MDRSVTRPHYFTDSSDLEISDDGAICLILVFLYCSGQERSIPSSSIPTSVVLNSVKTKLRCLDIFSGCGGLSLGLHQAGVVTTDWAIDIDQAAAKAYELNNPDCTVFDEDCNTVLDLLVAGQSEDRQGQSLPRRGEVDILCGGQPSLFLPQLCRIVVLSGYCLSESTPGSRAFPILTSPTAALAPR